MLPVVLAEQPNSMSRWPHEQRRRSLESSPALVSKTPPHGNHWKIGAPATPRSQRRLARATGQTDCRTSQPACDDQVGHGPQQAAYTCDALVCRAADQAAWRWAFHERGSVRSILGIAAALKKRGCSPLTAAAHVVCCGGGSSNQTAVPFNLGRSVYVYKVNPASMAPLVGPLSTGIVAECSFELAA